jgi:hypothetical protein
MGCDIHLVLEKRIEEGRWVAVDTFNGHHPAHREKGRSINWSSPAARSRNYRRFAKLAGVRGDGPAPRGLPDDLSQTARFLSDDYGVDGHSHSWLAISDAIPIFDETEYWLDSETPDTFARKFPADFFFGIESEHIDSYRLVFWFDN